MATTEAGGSFSNSAAVDLLSQVFDGLIRRSGLDPDTAHDAVVTCASESRNWMQPNIRRAMERVTSENGHIAIAGGVDCSPAHTVTNESDRVLETISAELIAAEYCITREQLDDYAARSHRRAAAVAAAGEFRDEIVPIDVRTSQGLRLISADTTTNPQVTTDSLATLPPLAEQLAFSERFPDIHWRITAGNSAPPAAGASAVLITTERRAEELQLSPRARIHALTIPLSSGKPAARLAGHVQASSDVLQQLDISMGHIDHFEICETSAATPLAWQAELEINPAVLNPRGGAISLGSPSGASTLRMLTTMLGALEATGGRYGLQIPAVGARVATTLIVESLRFPFR